MKKSCFPDSNVNLSYESPAKSTFSHASLLAVGNKYLGRHPHEGEVGRMSHGSPNVDKNVGALSAEHFRARCAKTFFEKTSEKIKKVIASREEMVYNSLQRQRKGVPGTEISNMSA